MRNDPVEARRKNSKEMEMSIFKRIFRIGRSHAHAIVDDLEDPIEMTAQGIRDLKKDLEKARESLAEVKGIAIRTSKRCEGKKRDAVEYERKAMLLLAKMEKGELAAPEAERLAEKALDKRDEMANEAINLAREAEHHEKMAADLSADVKKLKQTISGYENDLGALKARARTAASTKKINRQIAGIDSSGTISLLERMKAKVEEDESLAIAYREVADASRSVDEEIDNALSSSAATAPSTSLIELKKRMGIPLLEEK